MIRFRSRTRAARLALSILAAPLALSPLLTAPAHAIIVYDPTNYAQNVLQAARALQQINNQITSLQNEATMLINQARNLASLPFSSLQQLQQSVQRTQQLLNQAQNIAFDVQQIDRAFQQQYRNVSLSASDQQLVADARTRWQNTVGGLQDSMRVQAGVVGNIDTNRTQMSALVGQSQGATGALQATQAGNQLLALQAQQLADLTAVVAANGRAQARQSAEQAAAAEQGRAGDREQRPHRAIGDPVRKGLRHVMAQMVGLVDVQHRHPENGGLIACHHCNNPYPAGQQAVATLYVGLSSRGRGSRNFVRAQQIPAAAARGGRLPLKPLRKTPLRQIIYGMIAGK